MSAASPKAHSIASAAALLTVLAVLSPLAGVLVEMVLAWRYGASGTVDAYRTAYLLIGFGNQLFIAYLLPHIVVPMITEFRARGDEEQGWRVAMTTGHILGGAGLLFAIGVCFYPVPLAQFLAPGLAGPALSETVVLLRFFSVALVLALWSGIITGILYVHRVFALSPLSQMITNVLVMVAVIASGKLQNSVALGTGVLLGFGAMFGMHVYYLFRIAKTEGLRMSVALKPGRMRDVGKLLLTGTPLLGILLATQFGNVVINRELSRLSIGTLARFGFAWKLLALASLAPTSLATVIFPAFSEAQAREQSAEFARLITRAIRMTLLLTIPISAVLYFLREPIVRVLFGRGAMSDSGLAETALLFGLALIQGPAGSLTFLFQKVFFSLGDTRTPTVVSVVAAAVLAVALPAAAAAWGAVGVVLAYSAIMWLGAFGLMACQFARLKLVRYRDLLGYSVTLAILSVVIGAPVWLIHTAFSAWGAMTLQKLIFELAASGLVAAALAWKVAPSLHIAEAEELLQYVRWQMARVHSRPV